MTDGGVIYDPRFLQHGSEEHRVPFTERNPQSLSQTQDHLAARLGAARLNAAQMTR